MVEVTTARVSALAGNYPVGRHGKEGSAGVRFAEAKNLKLWQVATWPDTFNTVAAQLTESVISPGATVPGFGQSSASDAAVLLRVEPLKLWVMGAEPPVYEAKDAVTVDLSHSRTLMQLKGEQATTILNSYLPLDLREAAFPVGSVASTAFHHCGVTLWRADDYYGLFLPRGFAMSLWELLMESAMQYGCEVVA